MGPTTSRLGAEIPHTPENTDFYQLFISGGVHPHAVPPSHLALQASRTGSTTIRIFGIEKMEIKTAE